MMRRLLIMLPLAVLASSQANAQFFVPGGDGLCVTFDLIAGIAPCGSWIEQQISYVLQGIQEAHELETMIDEDLNTLKLPATLFQDATQEIANITAIAHEADLLGGHTGDFITKLGADVYPLPDDPQLELTNQRQAISNAIEQLGNIIGVANPLLAPRSTVLAALNDQSLTAEGRLQAMQSAQSVGATTGQMLHEVETILMGIAQGQHATMLSLHDKQSTSDMWAHNMAANYVPIPLGNAPGY